MGKSQAHKIVERCITERKTVIEIDIELSKAGYPLKYLSLAMIISKVLKERANETIRSSAPSA